MGVAAMMDVHDGTNVTVEVIVEQIVVPCPSDSGTNDGRREGHHHTGGRPLLATQATNEKLCKRFKAQKAIIDESMLACTMVIRRTLSDESPSHGFCSHTHGEHGWLTSRDACSRVR